MDVITNAVFDAWSALIPVSEIAAIDFPTLFLGISIGMAIAFLFGTDTDEMKKRANSARRARIPIQKNTTGLDSFNPSRGDTKVYNHDEE